MLPGVTVLAGRLGDDHQAVQGLAVRLDQPETFSVMGTVRLKLKIPQKRPKKAAKGSHIQSEMLNCPNFWSGLDSWN